MVMRVKRWVLRGVQRLVCRLYTQWLWGVGGGE